MIPILLLQFYVKMDTVLSEELVLYVPLKIVPTVVQLILAPPVLPVGLEVKTEKHVMHVLKVVLVVLLNVSA